MKIYYAICTLLLSSFGTFANTFDLGCNGCSLEQMRAEAERVGQQKISGVYQVTVVDFVMSKFQRYRVSVSAGNTKDPSTPKSIVITAINLPNDANVTFALQALSESRQVYERTLREAMGVRSPDITSFRSATDALQAKGEFQNHVQEYLRNSSDLNAIMIDSYAKIRDVASGLGITIARVISLEFKNRNSEYLWIFADGSTIPFILSFNVDSLGNQIAVVSLAETPAVKDKIGDLIPQSPITVRNYVNHSSNLDLAALRDFFMSRDIKIDRHDKGSGDCSNTEIVSVSCDSELVCAFNFRCVGN